ncbi:peptidoglycan-binding protein [Streptomyces venezuelae]|uniref:peptidoglycan-binding protein n=1 Tax=Streptomyces venezuelae TaxID=54571 RepID=UPI00345336B8
MGPHERTRIRRRTATRALLGLGIAAGLAAGSLAGATAATATTAQPPKPTATAHPPKPAAPSTSTSATPLSQSNLGLTPAEAKKVQIWLAAHWQYTGPINGALGTSSWAAFQRCLKAEWNYTGPINGVLDMATLRSLHKMLRTDWGLTEPFDGTVGPKFRAAFKRFANGV